MIRILAAAMLLAGLHGFAAAAEPVGVLLGEEVAGHPGVTYFDLLRQAVPTLAVAGLKATASSIPAVRHLADSDYVFQQPEEIELSAIGALPFRAQGEDRLLLLADLGWSPQFPGKLMLLMLFDGAPEPRLLDAADIGLDRNTGFGEPAVLDLSADDQAALITNAHWNSNQSYVDTALVFVRDGELTLIDDIFTFTDHSCAFESRQIPLFTSLPDPARPYADVRVRVDVDGRIIEWDCGDEQPQAPYSRAVEVTYRWDEGSGRYVPDSDALVKLGEESAERF